MKFYKKILYEILYEIYDINQKSQKFPGWPEIPGWLEIPEFQEYPEWPEIKCQKSQDDQKSPAWLEIPEFP